MKCSAAQETNCCRGLEEIWHLSRVSVSQPKNSDFVWGDADELLMLFPPQSASCQIKIHLRKKLCCHSTINVLNCCRLTRWRNTHHIEMLRWRWRLCDWCLFYGADCALGRLLCEARRRRWKPSPPFIPLVEHEITGQVQPKLLLHSCFHRCFSEATCRRR